MWSAGSRARRNLGTARGFSLLELLVVMLIVGLSLAAIAAALPGMQSGPAIELATSRLAAGLKKARMRAVGRQEVETVLIDPGARHYHIGATGNRVRLPDTVTVWPLRSPAIRFYPDGGADAATIRLTEGRRTAHIDVSPMTGGVTIR